VLAPAKCSERAGSVGHPMPSNQGAMGCARPIYARWSHPGTCSAAAGAKVLGPALAANAHLQRLDLSCSRSTGTEMRIGEEGVAAMARGAAPRPSRPSSGQPAHLRCGWLACTHRGGRAGGAGCSALAQWLASGVTLIVRRLACLLQGCSRTAH
jgi:hypothetical protein